MKQRENARSKASSTTQERLIARETYQYVTTNPRQYGVASTRNERQLAKAMDSLHMQQSKRLAKLTSEIHEVKVHQWKLKEADETIREPNTSDKKSPGAVDATEPKNQDVVMTQGKNGIKHSKSPRSRNNKGIDRLGIGRNKSMTYGDIQSSKTRSSRMKANNNERIFKYDRINGLTKTDLYKTSNGPERQSSTPQGVTVDYALKHMPIRRDTYKYKSYNLINAQKFAAQRGNSPRDGATHTKEPQGVNETREKNSLNKNHVGKLNNKLDARPRSEHVPNVYEIHQINYGHRGANDLPTHTKGTNLHFQESFALEGEAVVSDQEMGDQEERANVTEENWAETLKSCRYLRKPRGQETPEIPIESIFQND